MTPYVGEIRLFAFGYAPAGDWAPCNGREYQITYQPALFAVIGNRFGGDGKTTFAVPNLYAARLALGAGAGPGLTPRTMGQAGGANEVTLDIGTIPPHTHVVKASNELADVNTPAATTAIARSNGSAAYGPSNPQKLTKLDPSIVGPAPGGGRPHNNMMPYVALYYAICLKGLPGEELPVE